MRNYRVYFRKPDEKRMEFVVVKAEGLNQAAEKGRAKFKKNFPDLALQGFVEHGITFDLA